MFWKIWKLFFYFGGYFQRLDEKRLIGLYLPLILCISLTLKSSQISVIHMILPLRIMGQLKNCSFHIKWNNMTLCIPQKKVLAREDDLSYSAMCFKYQLQHPFSTKAYGASFPYYRMLLVRLWHRRPVLTGFLDYNDSHR